MPEAKSLVSQEEMARIFKEKRETLSYVSELEEGFYTLNATVKNAFADKRVKTDWRAEAQLEAGTRFIVRHDVHNDVDFSEENKQPFTYRETVIFPYSPHGQPRNMASKRFIEQNKLHLGNMTKEPPSLSERLALANRGDWRGFNEAVIILLLGALTAPIKAEEVIRAVAEMSTEDTQALRGANGF